jgi:3-dehydroquinate dehydratase-2
MASGPAVLVLHGPNLNLLGVGEPGAYGRETLANINARLVAEASARGIQLSAFQSNHEGALIDRVHLARQEGVRYIVVNAGGLAQTSVSLRDALIAVGIPYIEVHLSNAHMRESLRSHSLLSAKAVGTIAGLGNRGYDFAVAFALAQLVE